MKKFLILSLLLCFFMTNTPLVFAESLSEKQERIEQQAQEKKNKIQEATDKLNEVSEKMRILQAELDEANTAYNEIKVKLDNANEQIAQKEKQLADTEQSLKKNQKYLQKRVRDIYIHGQISYLDILFGAKDFSDFLTRMDLIKRILRYDYDLITKIHQERNSIIQTKAELEKEKTATEKLYDEAKTKKFALDKMIDRIKYDKETSEKAYKELMNASEQIALMIQRRGASAYVGTGQMIWPLGGPITSEYGWRTHPIYGNARYHSGIDIGGDYGMNIYAADSGTVTYSGWISGYGNTVIIDHGNGVSTLYGHNQSLTVSVGQNISQGDVIAHCGSTGNSTGPHCHFEVRVNGEPTNPYDYL